MSSGRLLKLSVKIDIGWDNWRC